MIHISDLFSENNIPYLETPFDMKWTMREIFLKDC